MPGLLVEAIEPAAEILGRNHHRHAVMDRRNLAIGTDGEDGGRVHFGAVGAHVGFHQPAEGDDAALLGPDPVGNRFLLRAFRRPAPFVKARRGNEDPPVPHSRTERGLLRRRLRARIDQQRKIRRILDPARQETPARQERPAVGPVVALRAAHVAGNDQDRLGRCNIVARREILDLLEPEQFLHLLGGCRQRKTSTHCQSMTEDRDRVKQ
jgi:hypothetical protein